MSSRREFLKQGTAAAAATMISHNALAAPSTGAGERPNIVLILVDDMGFSDIGCFGSEVDTPNLDKLAARGMRTSQFYNSPRCCPSRAALMTGLYSHQAGMGMMVVDAGRYPYPAYAGDLSAQTLTMPEALKSAGYNTAMTGKWHLTPETPETGKHNWPLQRGFDKFWGMIAGASIYFHPFALIHDNEKLPIPTDPNFYYTDAIADHAAGYIDEFSKEKKPYFIYCAFNAAHWPIQAPEKDIQKYATRYAGGWDALREERHKKQLAMKLLDPSWKLTPRDARVPAWKDVDHKEWEMRRMAVYAAMIDRMDRGVGRIIDAVEKAGQMDNTLFVFMADNGGNAEEMGPSKKPNPNMPGVTVGNIPSVMPGSDKTYQSIGIPWGNCANTPFRLYKHYAHEGGVSSPFIACWPRVIKPQAHPVAAVGHETDLMPTFLEAAGAKYPASVKAGPLPALVGQSMMPLFRGGTHERKPIFWEHEGNKAVRDGKWKLVSRFPEGWELYDMDADRTELHDLAAKNPDRVKHMSAMYDDWAKMVGAQPWPMPQTPAGERTGELRTPDYLEQAH